MSPPPLPWVTTNTHGPDSHFLTISGQERRCWRSAADAHRLPPPTYRAANARNPRIDGATLRPSEEWSVGRTGRTGAQGPLARLHTLNGQRHTTERGWEDRGTEPARRHNLNPRALVRGRSARAGGGRMSEAGYGTRLAAMPLEKRSRA